VGSIGRAGGKSLSKKADKGDGWLTGVFSTKYISLIGTKFVREAFQENLTRSIGLDLN
jgi:hypothetical protein